MLDILYTWDEALFLFFNTILSLPLLDPFFTTITHGRFWIAPGAGLVLLLFLKLGWKKTGLLAALSIATVAITDPLGAQILKPLFHRLRPCNPDAFVEGGRFLLGFKTTLSFPSIHAMNMFGQATVFSLLYRRCTLWFFLFAGLIGYSRIYVGVHYPFDVLGGAVFGMICGAAVYGGYRRISTLIITRGKEQADQSSQNSV
ncbi:MAG: phosphatase PAP2 family protein [Chitinispirillaceae bacterium]|nr:phosphatase PAP2 family protein [Chitinispirillaceae bacterium]